MQRYALQVSIWDTEFAEPSRSATEVWLMSIRAHLPTLCTFSRRRATKKKTWCTESTKVLNTSIISDNFWWFLSPYNSSCAPRSAPHPSWGNHMESPHQFPNTDMARRPCVRSHETAHAAVADGVAGEEKDEFWHGIFWVPQQTQQTIMNQFRQARSTGGGAKAKGSVKHHGVTWKCLQVLLLFSLTQADVLDKPSGTGDVLADFGLWICSSHSFIFST